MDPLRKHLSRFRLPCLLGLAVFAGLWQACAAERTAAREVLADPAMRFRAARPIDSPASPPARDDESLPVDTLSSRVALGLEPGAGAQATYLVSSLRTAVDLWDGFGIEAGYGTDLDRSEVFKRDGFSEAQTVERLSHGPDAALVYDDGTSVLRAGYRYRHAWDGDLHEPSVRARTAVLSRDTVIEIDYRHRRQAIDLGSEHHTAVGALAQRASQDLFLAAIEQGFVPGWNLRLEMTGSVDKGFLQNPYHLVSLWSHRPSDPEISAERAPRAEPERHPEERIRWAGLLRIRRALPALNSVFELGLGHGSGTWRVEHSRAQVGWSLRLSDQVSLGLAAGAYHQTRALFYRDDYPEGPTGATWSADRRLSSYWAWWSELDLRLSWLAERGRLLGMFKHVDLCMSARLLRADFNFEGLDSPNGFTSYSEQDFLERQAFDAGWIFGGMFGFEAGF